MNTTSTAAEPPAGQRPPGDPRWTVHETPGSTVSEVAPTLDGAPATWREHWRGHGQLLELVDESASAAVYLDRDVPKAAGRRLPPYVTGAWQYATDQHGSFGPDPRLYAVVHGGRHQGSHRGTYLEVAY